METKVSVPIIKDGNVGRGLDWAVDFSAVPVLSLNGIDASYGRSGGSLSLIYAEICRSEIDSSKCMLKSRPVVRWCLACIHPKRHSVANVFS